MQNLAEKLGIGDSLTSTLLWIGLSIVILLVVLALAVWLVRTLRPSLNLGGSQARGGRPQRLAITDAFSMDREGRKLVIVRRDNTEHLLLIGGPNDILVESCIVRGERGVRERGRSLADPDLVQAAEAALGAELPRFEPAAPENIQVAPPAPPAPSAPPPRPPAITAAPISRPHTGAPLDSDFENALSAMQAAQRQLPPVPAPAPAPASPPAPAPRLPDPAFQPGRFQPMPDMPAPPPASAPATAPAAAPGTPSVSPQAAPGEPPQAARQQPMSEMARRLNEVLQKPMSGTLRPPFNRSIPPAPPLPTASAPEKIEPAPALPAAPPPPTPEILKPGASTKPQALPPEEPAGGPPAAAKVQIKPTDIEMDLLEEEMARLLGRPQAPGSGTP